MKIFRQPAVKDYSEKKEGRCNAPNGKSTSQYVVEGLLHQGVCGKGAEEFAREVEGRSKLPAPQYTLPSSVQPASLQRTVRPSWSIIMLPSSTLRIPLIFLPWIARGVDAWSGVARLV